MKFVGSGTLRRFLYRDALGNSATTHYMYGNRVAYEVNGKGPSAWVSGVLNRLCEGRNIAPGSHKMKRCSPVQFFFLLPTLHNCPLLLFLIPLCLCMPTFKALFLKKKDLFKMLRVPVKWLFKRSQVVRTAPRPWAWRSTCYLSCWNPSTSSQTPACILNLHHLFWLTQLFKL